MASSQSQKPLGFSSSGSIEIQERDQSDNLVATYITTAASGGQGKGTRVDVDHGSAEVMIFLPVQVSSDTYNTHPPTTPKANVPPPLGIGVGDSHASPTSALLLSVLQESMGRIATILFAHRLGTALEPECKMYRLAADVFNDAAMILDCLSPALPKASRVVLLSFSSVLRALCGVAAGSSKASLSAHFATQGNLGELNAKDSSQETIISLLGMLAGSLVVSLISSQWATWSSMIALLAIHLGTNYLAVRAVSMRTINRQRANLLMSHALDQLLVKNRTTQLTVLTPEEVSLQERIFERDGVLRWRGGPALGWCRIGVPLSEILSCLAQAMTSGAYKSSSDSGSKSVTIEQLLAVYETQGYIMWYDRATKTCLVVLKSGTQSIVHLDAWMHALLFVKDIEAAEKMGEEVGGDEAVLGRLQRTLAQVLGCRREAGFYGVLEEAGWDLEVGAMETRSGTRIRVAE
ncbi:DUF647 domain-containing protein [Rutstroemia sp. NJR-2017a BBW]|nr:DUF647 domain-containing protein [Rutstroemia sp. NJR-2017a BBW]